MQSWLVITALDVKCCLGHIAAWVCKLCVQCLMYKPGCRKSHTWHLPLPPPLPLLPRPLLLPHLWHRQHLLVAGHQGSSLSAVSNTWWAKWGCQGWSVSLWCSKHFVEGVKLTSERIKALWPDKSTFSSCSSVLRNCFSTGIHKLLREIWLKMRAVTQPASDLSLFPYQHSAKAAEVWSQLLHPSYQICQVVAGSTKFRDADKMDDFHTAVTRCQS